MNQSLKILVLQIGVLMLFYNCSSMSVVKIDGRPGKAEIFAKQSTSQTETKLGETPYTTTSSDLNKLFPGGGALIVELRKDGYVSKTAVITDYSARDIDISLELKPKDMLEYSNTIDAIVSDLFECQQLIRKKQYDEAEKILAKLKTTHPYLSVIYEFEGGLYLVKKDFVKALDAFKIAIKYNANNVEALRLKRAVEKELKLAP